MNRPTIATLPDAASDQGLVDSIRLPEATLNRLFAALLVTAGGVFLSGNLMFLDPSVVKRSGLIALAGLTVLTIFYTLSAIPPQPGLGAGTHLPIARGGGGLRPSALASCPGLGLRGLRAFVHLAFPAGSPSLSDSPIAKPRVGFCDTRQWGWVLLMGMVVLYFCCL